MIQMIKVQGNGWKVNGIDIVPNDEGNSDCQDVLAYIADGGIVEDEFTAEELEAQRIAGIKAEARVRILSVMSEDAQRNSLAETMALQAIPEAERTAEHIALFIEIKAAWAMIDAIRKASNEAEALGTALGDIVWPI